MKLGLFMMPLHKVGSLDYTAMYQQDLEAIVHADRLGYDEAWVGEHYTAKPEPITNPLQFMSALIPLTERIRFGTGVLALGHHHPAKVAGDVAMFDHMSRGRFILGIGPGGLGTDFELFGLEDPPLRGQRMLDCIELVEKIWASDPPYRIEGRFWTIKVDDARFPELEVGIIPKPYQKPFPPLTTSAMNVRSGMAKLAGERGWSLISANFNPVIHVAGHWERYCEGCEAAGRRPDRRLWRVARSILVTGSDAEAEDYLADPDNGLLDYFRYLRIQLSAGGMINIFKPDETMDDALIDDRFCVDAMVIAGSPKTVLDRLVDVVDQTGPFGTLLAAFHHWDRAPLWRRSMALLAEEVAPALGKLMRERGLPAAA